MFKHGIQQQIETHKTRLRKSAFLFQKELEATSAIISLRRVVIPKHCFPRWNGMTPVRISPAI
jgi:hypothetical protein